MKPEMFWTKSSGMPRRSHSSMKCAALSADSLKRIPLLAMMPTGWPSRWAKRADDRRAVERLELLQLAAVDDAPQHVAHVVGRARVERDEVEQAVRVLRPAARGARRSHGGAGGARQRGDDARARSPARARRRRPGGRRRRSVRACTSPPPSSSAVTSSPVAAFTSGGPPRKIVPCSRTITVSSLIAGTYAPPAVHEPMTQAICGIAALRTSSPG